MARTSNLFYTPSPYEDSVVVVNETREDKTKKEKPGLQRHIPYEQIKGVFSTGRGGDQRIKAFYTTRPEKDSYHK